MRIKLVTLLAALSAMIAGSGCQRAMKAEGTTNGTSTLNAATVIAQNSSRLMGLPDVVGVYEGLMPDGKTHCIVVMLAKTNSATVKQLPSSLGYFPVRAEVTGEVKPVGK